MTLTLASDLLRKCRPYKNSWSGTGVDSIDDDLDRLSTEWASGRKEAVELLNIAEELHRHHKYRLSVLGGFRNHDFRDTVKNALLTNQWTNLILTATRFQKLPAGAARFEALSKLNKLNLILHGFQIRKSVDAWIDSDISDPELVDAINEKLGELANEIAIENDSNQGRHLENEWKSAVCEILMLQRLMYVVDFCQKAEVNSVHARKALISNMNSIKSIGISR